MFSWSFEESVTTKASVKNIWKVWSDVKGWSNWDHELEWAELDGDFAPGVEGRLKAKDWPVSTFVMTEVEWEKSFKDLSKMPLTQMEFNHTIEPSKEGVRITHSVSVKGLLAPILYLKLRKRFQAGFPVALKKLAAIAESL